MRDQEALAAWNVGRVSSLDLIDAFVDRFRHAMTAVEFWRARRDRFRQLADALDARRQRGHSLTIVEITDRAVITYSRTRGAVELTTVNPPEVSEKLSKMHQQVLEYLEQEESPRITPVRYYDPDEEELLHNLGGDERERLRIELPNLGVIADIPDQISEADTPLARVLSLRLFGGWTLERIAQHQNTSVEDVERLWMAARRWVSRPETESIGRIAVFDVLDRRLLRLLTENPKLIHALNWRTFERMLAGILEDLGYTVELQQGTKDGGIDIVAIRQETPFGAHRYLVQAKKWSHRVGVAPVRELLYLQQQYGATKACLATTSTFTRGAWQMGREHWWRLELRDFERLQEWIAFAANKQ